MAHYSAHKISENLWTVVEDGSTNPVAGGDGFQTGMSKEEAERLAARMNQNAADGKGERQG